jgi:DNA-binding MarR family transcriptional regulator
MARKKGMGTELSVFKGKEAKLNRVIFRILAEKSCQAKYDITKAIRHQRGLKHTKYTNVSRRIKALEEQRYIARSGFRTTQSGSETILYELTTRAYVALMLSRISLDKLVREADEETLAVELAAAMLIFETASENTKGTLRSAKTLRNQKEFSPNSSEINN